MQDEEKENIGIASDHIGFELKEFLIKYLMQKGWKVKNLGTYDKSRTDYPIFAQKLAREIKNGKVDTGILICGTGIGISIAANRHKNIRCALCSEEYSARMARAHNNANILALGAHVINQEAAIQIIEAWLDESYEGGRHEKRIQQIDTLHT